MAKNDLRSLILDKGSKFTTTEITIEDQTFLLKSPSVFQRSEILKEAKATDTENIRIDRLQVYAVIYLTLDPETSKPVFTKADEKVLLNLPSGSFFDELSEAATKLLNVDKASIDEVGND